MHSDKSKEDFKAEESEKCTVHKEQKNSILKVDKYGYAHSVVRGFVLPPFLTKDIIAECQANVKLGQKDIVIATYPKCGTTLMQQLVLTLLYKGDQSRVPSPMYQAPWIEASIAKNPLVKNFNSGTELTKWDGHTKFGPPPKGGYRVFKTHANSEMMPWCKELKGGRQKIILVERNPFDVAVSLFHHARNVGDFEYTGNIDHFVKNLYCKGKVESGDFWKWHAGWHAVAEKNEDSVLRVSFEGTKSNPIGVVKRVANFLGLDVSEEICKKTVDAISFKNMKDSFSKNDARRKAEGQVVKKNHIRKGKVGNWKNELNKELQDLLIATHKAKSKELGHTFDFVFELSKPAKM
mmetsp:Transcript_19964/g.29890  ORF Transcript_19964/g.29890 Transcript_19964/m.29890 type:complete len:350 (+) Transcript_19964:41-1090(+)